MVICYKDVVVIGIRIYVGGIMNIQGIFSLNYDLMFLKFMLLDFDIFVKDICVCVMVLCYSC